MKKIVLLVIMAIMAFSFSVKAQVAFDSFGKPKKEVVEKEKMGEEVPCTTVSIIHTLTCKVFIDGKYAQYWIISTNISLKDYRKDIIESEIKYGEPLAYWADGSKVKTFKQALELSERKITVKFNDKKSGLYRIVEFGFYRINELSRGGTQAHIIQPNNVDYFSEYNDQPIIKSLEIKLHRIAVMGAIKKSFKGW